VRGIRGETPLQLHGRLQGLELPPGQAVAEQAAKAQDRAVEVDQEEGYPVLDLLDRERFDLGRYPVHGHEALFDYPLVEVQAAAQRLSADLVEDQAQDAAHQHHEEQVAEGQLDQGLLQVHFFSPIM
jgi:hypothetical protein